MDKKVLHFKRHFKEFWDKDAELTGYFRDGVRRIDIILVVEDRQYDEIIDKIRINFLLNMIKKGLEIEVETISATNMIRHHGRLVFIKVHAPQPVIEEFGNYYNIRKYFKKTHNEFINPSQSPLSLKTEGELIKNIRQNYPGPYPYSNLERSTIVYHILLSLPFGDSENFVGLQRLLDRNIIVDVYALHDGPYFFIQNEVPRTINGRQALFYHWVGIRNIFQRQPVHLIREYFGEKVAFYFAFYEYFIFALIFATILGIFATVEGITDVKDDGVIEEACSEIDTNGDIRTICPQCRDFNICPFRNLTDFCTKVIIINFIDNPWTMIYCILLSVWAILFVLLWRRRKNYLSWMWEYDMTDTQKTIRAKFHSNVNDIRISKLTGIISDTDSINTRILQLVLTALFLLLWALLVMIFTMNLIIFKYYLSAKFAEMSIIWSDYFAVASITSIYVLIMNLFKKLSHILSNQLAIFENPKTNNFFETSFIIKLYGFGFICNFFLFVSYYFLNVLYTYPSDKNRWHIIGGLGMMNCGPESCMDELCVAIIVNTVVQDYIMKLHDLILKTKTDYTVSGNQIPCWEREYQLEPLTEYVLIEKINNIVMKFTLVGLFGTAFPLAPLLLMISGICHIRYEARQFLLSRRRPLLRQPSSQGVWFKIMLAIVYAAPCFNTVAMTWMTTTLHYTRTNSNHTSSYFMFSMGRFVTEDYKKVTGPGSPAEALNNYNGSIPKECLFPGLRFRSKDLDGKYYPIERFWRIRYDKHKLMLEVEHLALVLIVIFHYLIPAFPRDIADIMKKEDRIKRRARLGKIN